MLLEQLAQTIGKRGLLKPGQRVLVAVSGGADSMVLLHALHALSNEFRWRLAVAHFNHRLRGRSSDADERLVRCEAKRLKLPLVVECGDVREHGRRREVSLEMAARELRHEFLARAAARLRIRTVALAHHTDDQLELFFLRLLRGSGGLGLGGMKWRSSSPANARIELVRPFLETPKAALLEFARTRKVPFREDASNACMDMQRNRIRHELLPLLRSKYQAALDRVIPRVIELLVPEADLANELAQQWLLETLHTAPQCLPGAKRLLPLLLRRRRPGRGGRTKPSRGTGSSESVVDFEELPLAVQRRCIQLQLVERGIEPDFEMVERLRVAPGKTISVQTPAAGPPLGVVRERTGLLRLQQQSRAGFREARIDVNLGKSKGGASFGGATVSWRIRPGKPVLPPVAARSGRECFDAEQVGERIILRHWRPGDRFQPIGMKQPIKLQDLFTNQKVPRAQRHNLLVATTGTGELFWVEGLRISERFKLTKATNRCLLWGWQRP